MTDVLFVGGGLANCLAAWRLAHLRPGVRWHLLEQGSTLGGNHTWSFHDADVTPAQREWMTPLVSASWSGYRVAFPGAQRRLSGGYASIRSADLHARVSERFPDRIETGARAVAVRANEVVLDSGQQLSAKVVIDGRGVQAAFECGYQKFFGVDVSLKEPHGLREPLLMDATVEQLGGFRFIYVLPWDAKRVLLEDTVYSDTAEMNLPQMRERLLTWAQLRGWEVDSIDREECAALPIPLRGHAPQHVVPTVGVSAAMFHATTGYSLSCAVATADFLVEHIGSDSGTLAKVLNARSEQHWKSQRFFRALNRMLFLGATPSERVKVLAAFYRNRETVIQQFYAGKLDARGALETLRYGAGTVPTFRAMRALLG